jgi:hypothetical protein
MVGSSSARRMVERSRDMIYDGKRFDYVDEKNTRHSAHTPA